MLTANQRLPSLQFRDEAEAAAMHPGIVLTATSRYRNDPYRLDVRAPFFRPAPPGDAMPMGQTPYDAIRPSPLEAAAPFLPVSKSLRPSRHTLPALPHAQTEGQRRRGSRPPRDSTPSAQQPVEQRLEEEQHPHEAEEKRVALIKFKRTHLSASYDPAAVAGLSVGSIVIVQGDRGEHIATVVSAHLAKPKSFPTKIIRLATGDDLLQFQRVQEDEAIALDACRAHATRLGLDSVMHIEDVEFQLDFQKLTIFFRSLREGAFVDFRNLQRALYQHFRCRIWIVDC